MTTSGFLHTGIADAFVVVLACVKPYDKTLLPHVCFGRTSFTDEIGLKPSPEGVEVAASALNDLASSLSPLLLLF